MIDVDQPFENDISEVLKKYSDLIFEEGPPRQLVGKIDILDADGFYWANYSIRIEFPTDFPASFPKLFETGGRIPKEADWHIFNDDSCCTTVRQRTALAVKRGITALRFLDEFAIPYLANHRFKELNGEYANGEYSHGAKGEIEYLKDTFKTQNRLTIFAGLHLLAKDALPSRQSLCFCGSGQKFRHCHKESLAELFELPINERRRLFVLALDPSYAVYWLN